MNLTKRQEQILEANAQLLGMKGIIEEFEALFPGFDESMLIEIIPILELICFQARAQCPFEADIDKAGAKKIQEIETYLESRGISI